MPVKLLFILSICTILNLTVTAQNSGGGPIPPDFKCPDCILVILDPESKRAVPNFEKHVEKQFKKYYSGKYEIATAKELETESRFQDKKIYRFTLNHKIRYDKRSIGDKDVTKYYIRFYLQDRESGAEYPSFGEGRTGDDSLEKAAKSLEAANK